MKELYFAVFLTVQTVKQLLLQGCRISLASNSFSVAASIRHVFSCWFSVPSQPIFPCIGSSCMVPIRVSSIYCFITVTSRSFSLQIAQERRSILRPPLTCIFALAFNGNVFLFFYCRFIFLPEQAVSEYHV